MEKIVIQDVIRFIDVWHADILEETKNILNTWFTSYRPLRNPDNLYGILFYDEDLQNAGIEITPECRADLEELRTLCNAQNARYVHVTYPPGQLQVTRCYTAVECSQIGRIAIVLADHYLLILCKAAQQGYVDAVDILYSWANEFFESYGDVESENLDWEEIIIQWGQQRLGRFRAEGV